MEKQFDILRYRQDIGKRIISIRQSLGLNMTEFGKGLNGGVNAGVVQRWERGFNLPKIERIIELAQKGNVSVSWLLYGLDDPNFQNHFFEKNFRELENFEIQLKKIRKNKSEINKLQNEISQNLQKIIKQALTKKSNQN